MLLSVALLGASVPAIRGENTVSADLTAIRLASHEDGRPVSLAGFGGGIVVLDFFAYWCAPCRTVSRALEQEVRAHYLARGGNPAGIPVQLVSVNIESEQPGLTEAFIRETGLEQVWHDHDGRLYSAFRGEGLPLVVALDLTQSGKVTIVFRSSGLESIGPLRGAIDAIGGGGSTGSDNASESGPVGVLAISAVEALFEGNFSDDLQLTQSLIRYRSETSRNAWDVAVGLASIGIDYRPSPFDFLGSATRVDELRPSIAANVRHRPADRWTLLAGAGYYDGFTDYRSAWFNEYFEQQFNNPSVGTVPGFVAADPEGFNVSGGVRHEYLPAAGFIEFNGSYQRDRIAPGYEIDFNGLTRGIDLLESGVYRLTFENVPHRRVRTRLDLQITDTTERNLRHGINGAANVALGEAWTLRLLAGGAIEDPEFEAWFAGTALEYAVSPAWQLFASGRYYQDTGEIENSLSFSTAAPGVRAWHAGLGIRHVAGRSVFKLFAAPYFTDYEPVDLGTLFFANLYSDRSWVLIQAAWQFEF